MSRFIAVFLTIALLAIQTFIGGAKLVYGLPAYLLLGLTGLFAAFACQSSGTRLPWSCIAATLVFSGYILLRASLSPVDYLARTDFFMTLAALVVYFVSATCLTQAKERVTVLWILLVFALLHIIGGAIQFRNGDNDMLLSWIYRPDYGRRASGFYICPNHLAGLLEMLALLGLSLAIWGRQTVLVRVVLGYLVVACFAGIAITGSRGGYLSTVAGMVVFAGLSLLAIRRLRRKLFSPALAIALAGVAVTVGSAIFLMSKSVTLQQRLDTVYDPQNMRLLLWKASFQQLALNPVFGTGSGTYFYYGRQFRSEAVQNDPVHVHNDYLELLCEYGWVGAVLALVFLAVHFTQGWRGLWANVWTKLKPTHRTKSNELALVIGTLSALSALLVHSIMDFNLHIPANTVFVGALFGILARPGPTGREMTEPDAVSRRLRLIPAAVGAVLIALALPLIPGEYLGERARVALRDRQYAEARSFAERAMSYEPSNPDLYYYLGEAQHYLAMEQQDRGASGQLHAAAAKAFESGLQVFPQDLRLMLKLGRTLDLLGQFGAAEAVFSRAVAADPNFGNVYAQYGVHLHLQRRFGPAEQLYRKALSLGEKEIAPVGLQDLERERTLPQLDPFAEFVTIEEEEEEETFRIPGVLSLPEK